MNSNALADYSYSSTTIIWYFYKSSAKRVEFIIFNIFNTYVRLSIRMPGVVGALDKPGI